MGTVAAIGERTKVTPLALAGVSVLPAEDPGRVREAWAALPPNVTLVILTPTAADALGPQVLDSVRPLTAVMPV